MTCSWRSPVCEAFPLATSIQSERRSARWSSGGIACADSDLRVGYENDEATVELMRRHRHGQIVMRELYGTDYRDNNLVFAKPDGSTRDPRGVSQRFQTVRAAAGLPPIRLHDLRHGVGTTLVQDMNVSPEIARRQLGHASSRTTVDLYARHDRDELQRAAANSLAAKLRGER